MLVDAFGLDRLEGARAHVQRDICHRNAAPGNGLLAKWAARTLAYWRGRTASPDYFWVQHQFGDPSRDLGAVLVGRERFLDHYRFEPEDLALGRGVKLDVFWHFGAGSDEAHFTHEDVEELRQLIKLGFAEQVKIARNILGKCRTYLIRAQ